MRDDSARPFEFVRDYARERIRYAIITGRLRSDELHSAPGIGGLLGISANPVRSAMRDLEHEGLVETVRNKGYRIVTVGHDDLIEILELRLLIEVPVMGVIAAVIRDEELTNLDAVAGQMKQALAEQDRAHVAALDYEFHRRILASARNRRLADIVSRLLTQTVVALQPVYELEGNLENALNEHETLIGLLRSRDARAVREFSETHIRTVFDRLGVSLRHSDGLLQPE